MSRMFRGAGFVALLALASFELGCSSPPKAAPTAAVEAPAGATATAANFVLKDSAGADFKLADYKGKVVLLNFWATWCGPCKVEIPWFVEFNKARQDKGFAVVGVSMDDDGWKSVKPYLAAKKIDYRVVVGNDEFGKLYGGVDSLPTTFLIDRSGKVAYMHMGLVGKDVYEKEIATLLKD